MRADVLMWLSIILAVAFGALAIQQWFAGSWFHALVHLSLGFVFVGLAVRARRTV